MPWSPIPKFPDIATDLKRHGKTTRLEPLRAAIMKHTGLIREESLKRSIKAMEDLGYLKKIDDEAGLLWRICGNKPWDFDGPSKKEEEQKMDELLGGS